VPCPVPCYWHISILPTPQICDLRAHETIINLLEGINDSIDYETCTLLIDDGILSSLDVIQIIGELDDEFDITIPAAEIVPNNFNSLDAIVALVTKLVED